jgi:hypothetical protein
LNISTSLRSAKPKPPNCPAEYSFIWYFPHRFRLNIGPVSVMPFDVCVQEGHSNFEI